MRDKDQVEAQKRKVLDIVREFKGPSGRHVLGGGK